MIALFAELWRVIVALWNIGNYWLRVAIAIVALWPVAMLVVAFLPPGGAQVLVPIVAMAPVVGIVFALIALVDPAVVAIIAAFPRGRAALAGIATVIGFELLWGVYLSIVPVANDRGLIPLLVLVSMAILIFAVTGWRKTAITLVLILAGLTLIFFAGGRQKITEIAGASAAVSAGPVPTPMLGGNFAQFYVDSSDFREVRFPPMSWFKFEAKQDIIVRLGDGKEFHVTGNSTTVAEFVGGKIGARVLGFPDEIPGHSVWVRAYEVGPPVLVTVGVAQKKR